MIVISARERRPKRDDKKLIALAKYAIADGKNALASVPGLCHVCTQ